MGENDALPAVRGEAARNEPGQVARVNRRYRGQVIVIVDDGLRHGFVFEPGQVELEYVARVDSHPREERRMKIVIHGDGRMAASLDDLLRSQQKPDQQPDPRDGDQQQLEV